NFRNAGTATIYGQLLNTTSNDSISISVGEEREPVDIKVDGSANQTYLYGAEGEVKFIITDQYGDKNEGKIPADARNNYKVYVTIDVLSGDASNVSYDGLSVAEI